MMDEPWREFTPSQYQNAPLARQHDLYVNYATHDNTFDVCVFRRALIESLVRQITTPTEPRRAARARGARAAHLLPPTPACVSHYSRGGIKVCSRPLWGPISAGSRYHRRPRSEATIHTSRGPSPPAWCAPVSFKLCALPPYPPPSCATLIRARCLSRRARSARRGVKRGVVSGVKGSPRGYQPIRL